MPRLFNYNLIGTLLNNLSRINNYPSQLASFNSWFFINAHIFYFKLSNSLTLFSYINESLKLNNIRVYNKTFSLVSTCGLICKLSAAVIIILLF